MKKTVAILLSALLVFCAGSAVAYYNTASVGYDNAHLLVFEKEYVQVMDFQIFYSDVAEEFKKLQDLTPDNFITI